MAGSIARAPFIAGEPIREQKLVRADGSGFMAAILPTGMRAISTEISPETGAGGFILPNDRVDVILSKREKNPDRNGSADVVNSEIILTNVRVLAIDQAPKEKDGQNAVVGKTVTLELKPEQAETLARARQTGTLALALRSIADVNMVENTSDDQAAPEARRQHQRGSLRRPKLDDDTEVTERTLRYEMRGNQPAMRTFDGSRPVVFGRRRADAQSGADARRWRPTNRSLRRSATGAARVASRHHRIDKVRFLALGIGKSVIIDLPREVKDVLVADPKIANAVIRSAQRAYIIGAAVGQTNVVFFDAAGQQVAAYDIAVKRDLNGVRAALRQTLPGIQIEGVGDGVMLTGSVSSPIEAQQAGDLAARLVGGADKVVNSIVVRGRDQVMLKVTVAEVRRDIVKQMGVDLSASMNYGTTVVNFNNTNPFTANSATARPRQRPCHVVRLDAVGPGDAARDGKRRRGADAGRTQSDGDLRRVRDIHLRRRISDSDRRDLPNDRRRARSDNASRRSAYKKFGISLNFTPVVLTEGRISLRVMTEVSEVSTENALTGGARWNDDSLDQDPPRRNHAGNPLRRLDGDGRPDPGTDQAGGQRIARSRPIAGSWRAVQEPGLRQQPDRTDGHGDALCRSRGRAEGVVASR